MVFIASLAGIKLIIKSNFHKILSDEFRHAVTVAAKRQNKCFSIIAQMFSNSSVNSFCC